MTGWTAEPGSQLAQLRVQVHYHLDARWRYGSETRNRTYRWLAQKMGLKLAECHVRMFDEAACERALEIIKAGGDYHILAKGFEVAL